MGDRARTAVILVITVVWAFNFAAGVMIANYKAPPEINSIFMGTVGALLATAPIGNRRRSENSNQDQQQGRDQQSNDEAGNPQ